jgi:hypothetical protein
LTAEKQKEVYDQLKSGFGEFKSLEYSQTWFDNNSKSVVYRFRSIFGDVNKLDIRNVSLIFALVAVLLLLILIIRDLVN